MATRQACMLGGLAILGRRRSAPARIIAELYCPVSPSLPEFQRHDIDAASYGRINNCNTRPADEHVERVEGSKPDRPFEEMGQIGPRDWTEQIVRGRLQAMKFRAKLRPMYGDWLSDPPPTGHRPANTGSRATAMSPGQIESRHDIVSSVGRIFMSITHIPPGGPRCRRPSFTSRFACPQSCTNN